MSTRRLLNGGNCLYAILLALLILSRRAIPRAELVPAEGPSVVLQVNKDGLVRLDWPAATVFVANPEISDVQVKSSLLIYLIGRRAGQTTLYAVDDQERVLAAFQIHVVHDLEWLR